MADDKIELDVDIKVKNAGANKNVKQTSREVDKLSDRFTKLSKVSGKTFFAVGVGITSIAVGISALVKQASKIEDISIQFEVLTGSAANAKRLMEDLTEFAASTPFQFEGIANAGKQLLGFGFSVDEIKPRLRELGNVAAASGKPIEEISLIFGQVAAAGKLTGERLLQFQERAIPIGPAIAKTLGIAETAVKETVTKGGVDLATFQKAFASLSEEGGFAFGGLDKQSKTLSGTLSTLKDNIILAAAQLGQTLLPNIKATGKALITAVQGFKEFISFTQSFSADDDFDDYAEQIKNAATEITTLEKKLKKLKIAAIEAGPRGNFFTRTFGTDQESVLKKITEVEEAIRKLNIEKTAAEGAQLGLTNQYIAEAEAANQSVVATEETSTQKLAILKAQNQTAFDLQVAHIKALKELDPEKLAELEAQNVAEAELDAIKKAQELERKGQHIEALDNLDKIAFNKQKRISTARLAFDQNVADMKLKIAQQSSQLITAVLGTESKAAFAIEKAVAAAGILLADAKARALVPAQTATIPYPGNLAAAAQMMSLISISTGIGLATVAATTIKGLAKGGLVEGGTPGMDSVPALLQQNEMVVPAKTSFQDIVAAGRVIGEDAGDQEGTGVDVNVTVGFTDNAMELIEEKIVARRAIGVSLV